MTNGDGYAIQPQDWHPHAGQKKAIKFLLEHASGLYWRTLAWARAPLR